MIDENLMNTETLEDEDLFDEETKTESVEDSARLVLEELTNANNETDASGDGAEVQDGQNSMDASEAARILAKSKKPKKREVIQAKDLEPTPGQSNPQEQSTLEPPARFPVEYKEKFNKLPRPVQEQAIEFWSGMEGNMTKKLQEASRYVQKYQQLDQIVSHYAPMMHQHGFTETQAVAELFATWKNLKDKPAETLRTIANNLGLSPEEIFSSSEQPKQQFVSNPGLTKEDLQRILDEREQSRQLEQSHQSAVSEIETLRNEKDQNTGAYLYPELWDNLFLQRVQPLVKYHRETQPGISWAEATRRAVATSRGTSLPSSSPSPVAPRLTPNEEIQRIKQASVSVRPRGNGVIPGNTQAKRGESVRESAEAILAELSRH